MDSEDDTKDDVDSGNESSGDDVDFAMDVETHSTRERQTELEEYPYEVLSTEEIVQHMVDCIKEVNTVVEVSMLVVNNGVLGNEVTRTLVHCRSIFYVAFSFICKHSYFNVLDFITKILPGRMHYYQRHQFFLIKLNTKKH